MATGARNVGPLVARIEVRLMQIDSVEESPRPRDYSIREPLPASVEKATWVENASLFWDFRLAFARVAGIVFVLSILVVFLLPK
jgi:hypothetical protein